MSDKGDRADTPAGVVWSAALGPHRAEALGARLGVTAETNWDVANARVRGEVFEALATMGADVKGHRPSVEALIAPPYHLDREGRVKKLG